MTEIIIENTNIKSARCKHGTLLFPSQDQYIGPSLVAYGEWSEGELTLISKFVKPGGLIVEVGSNIGTHTVPLSKMLGPEGGLIAFEPQRLIHQILCTNLTINGASNVKVFNAGVGHRDTMIDVPEVPLGAAYNFGAVRIGEKSILKAKDRVRCMTIDGLSLKRLDFLKIDAEDFEPEILLGARETIKRLAPPILLEYNNHMQEEIKRVLRLFDYKAWLYVEPLYNPLNFNMNKENLFPGIASMNLLLTTEALPGVTDHLQQVAL